MSRTLSLNFREAINANESGLVPIFLVEIVHDDMGSPVTPIRLSTDPTTLVSDVPLLYKTVSQGEDWYFVPMEVVLPDERESAAPRSQLILSNISREVVEVMRSVTTPGRAKLRLVLYDGDSPSSIDNVEVESPWLDIVQAMNNAGRLTLDLALNSMTTEMVPTDNFDQANFPALQAAVQSA